MLDSERYQLWCGDCLEIMPSIPDGSIDLILADLPYGTTSCKWDIPIPLEPLWEQYRRIIRPGRSIVLTATQPFTSMLVMSNLDWYQYNWVHKKNTAGGFLNAKRYPLKFHEDVVVFFSKNNCLYNPQGMKKCMKIHENEREIDDGVVGNRPSRAPGTFHIQEWTNYPGSILEFPKDPGRNRTTKPVSLMEYLIKTYTNIGDTVLDNCFGSCSTGVACLNTRRRFIGIEKDPECFQKGKARLESHASAPSLLNLIETEPEPAEETSLLDLISDQNEEWDV